MLKIEDMHRELANLKRNYGLELDTISERVGSAVAKLEAGSTLGLKGAVSSHDAFNLSASCARLSELAGKIEQTENVIRWMTQEPKAENAGHVYGSDLSEAERRKADRVEARERNGRRS
jgi:hypothetical protein